MIRCMFDSNILDYIVCHSTLIEKLKVVVQAGKMSAYVTQVQLEEVEKMPNNQIRAGIFRSIPIVKVASIDISKLYLYLDEVLPQGGDLGTKENMIELAKQSEEADLDSL